MIVAVGALLVGLLLQIVIGSVIGAIILRAACSIFNALFGGKPIAQVVDRKPSNSVPAKSDSPYQSPSAYAAPNVSFDSSVPEPGFGNAFVICLFSSVINAAFGFVVGVGVSSLGPASTAIVVAGQGLSIAFGYIILAVIIKINLPTTIGRALAVTAFFFVITAFIVAGLALVVFFVMGSTLFFN